MAKAIAIIDIPDGINIEECCANYEAFHREHDDKFPNGIRYKTIQYEELVNLKPMPQKIDIELLNNMCKHCECLLNSCGKLCAYRSIDNDYCDEYEKLKGAIEQNEM